MSLLDFYNSFRNNFPEITVKADKEYYDYWGDFENNNESAHVWFEGLSNALNKEMSRGIPASSYKTLFEFMRKQYLFGSTDIQKCVDVAFVENLFWQIEPTKVKEYWLALPDILKELYINFHGVKPA